MIKATLLKSGKLPQISRRLERIGFKRNSVGRYVTSKRRANIQEISHRPDRIEDNCVWLTVRARKPFAYADAATKRIAQCRQERFQRELRLAKQYWLKTIQPYVKHRLLRGVELYVASDAYLRLRKAQDDAECWNRSVLGQHSPVSEESFVEWNTEEFHEPEETCRDQSPKPETLAVIAAQMMRKPSENKAPTAVMGEAHDLLLAAERYVEALPERKLGAARIVADFDMALITITFNEIAASNKPNSGRLPLLPPSGQKRKNIPKQEQSEKPLSVAAIRAAVKRHLDEHMPRLIQEQYERDQEDTKRLVKEGRLVMLGSGEPRTYQEWQRDNQKAIDDCMKNSRISLQHLCNLRWERFQRQWEQRENAASSRQASRQKSLR